MLKLTSQKGIDVYIAPQAILYMERLSPGGWTEVGLTRGNIFVKETPEAILAHPQMVYFLNPAMVLL